jgi:carotenoid cleavage dioxygenase-like enzyme
MASRMESIIRGVVVKGVQTLAQYNRKRLPQSTEPHPYLSGIHTPMTEELTLTDLRVEGSIPPALNGRYLRNGPNPAGPADPASYHWFSGHGMVHGIKLQDGKALWYRNRWVRGEDACKHLGEPIPSGPRRAGLDAPNTNVVRLGGRNFAIVEAGGTPVELDDELTTIAHNGFDGTLSGGYTAHPHRDPHTNETHAICYQGDALKSIWHTVLDSNAQVIRELPIAVEDGPSIHDSALTEHYVVIFDLPVTFSMRSLIAGYSFPYRWNEQHPARVGLLPRKGSADDVIWIDVEPCYVFHPANAFEDEQGRVIVDVVAHNSMFSQSKRGPDSQSAHLERWTIDPPLRQCTRTLLHSENQEFPRYDERLTTKPYRYIYSVAVEDSAGTEMSIADTLLFRYDLQRGESIARDFGPHQHPGEFVFVPRTDHGGEDDGWLIGLTINMLDDSSALHILNADDFTGPAQAIIHIPHRIPPGFHGNWLPDL